MALLVNSWKPHFVTTLGDNNYSAQVTDTNDQIIERFYHSYMSPYKGSYPQGSGARPWGYRAALGEVDSVYGASMSNPSPQSTSPGGVIRRLAQRTPP